MFLANGQVNLCNQVALLLASEMASSLLLSLSCTPSHMIDASEFECGMYTDIHPPLKHVKQFWCMAHICHLWEIIGA